MLRPEQVAVEGRKLVALIRLLKLKGHKATVSRYQGALETEVEGLRRRLGRTKRKERRRELKVRLEALEEALKETG